MKYSYNWLKELSKTQKTPQEVADLFTAHSFEVESLEYRGKGLEDIVVGEILDIKPHPGANRLQLALVDVGLKSDTDTQKDPWQTGRGVQIVCGAPNIRVGQKVPVVLPGTTLPGGIKIKKSKICGEVSGGMICALDELGLADIKQSGILVLPDDTPCGEKFTQAFGLDDWIIDLKVLSNRGHDALSHEGLAREIAVVEGRKLTAITSKKMLFPKQSTKQKVKRKSNLSVKISNTRGSHVISKRYMGAKLVGLSGKKTPQWIINRLEVCGVRSISSVVDITNYVMLELGQPMHAFDWQKVSKDNVAEIEVRTAGSKETLLLLDGSTFELTADDIVISANGEPVALAGVMGGQNSAVDGNTTEILLESAHFSPKPIRTTRQRLGVVTESAYRFERDTDPNLPERAMYRAIELLAEYAGATLEEVVDEYPFPVESWTITFSASEVSRLLGVEVSLQNISDILIHLGMEVAISKDMFTITVPTWRADVRDSGDVIEEIGRVFGYEKVPTIPLVGELGSMPVEKEFWLRRKYEDRLSALGIDEIYTYSFYRVDDARVVESGTESAERLTLKSPMNPTQAVVRRSVLPNLIRAFTKNRKHDDASAIYEIGKVYSRVSDVVTEDLRLGVVYSGVSASSKKQHLVAWESYQVLKGMVEECVSVLTDEAVETVPLISGGSLFHPTRSANIFVGQTQIGTLGELHPIAKKTFGCKQGAWICEISLWSLFEIVSNVSKAYRYMPIPKYPSVSRDISLMVPQKVSAARIESVFRESSRLLVSWELFDVYDVDGADTKDRSMAYHLKYRSDQKTLESKEVDMMFSELVQTLEKKLGVMLKR